MRTEKWEEETLNYLTDLYKNFWKELSTECMKCFRIDSHELFSNNVKELKKWQEQKIYNYWKKYVDDFDIAYHKYYIDRTSTFDVRFIPDDIFVGYIDGYLNNREIEPGVADKNYFDIYLKGFKLPKTYVHLINGVFEDDKYTIISKNKAIDILSKQKNITIKPSMASYGGKNITFLTNPTKKDIKNFLDNNECNNLIFQETIVQSNETAKLHPNSLNTIRIMTLLINNEIKILPAAFRIGVGESKVDNASFGGIYCKINSNGTLSNFAYNALGKRYDWHPDGGKFNEVKIPHMAKIKKVVSLAAQRFPHFRLIGWDIALNSMNEPVIIEANLTMSGLDVIETICGPLFGEYTDKILDEIFLTKHTKPISIDISQYV